MDDGFTIDCPTCGELADLSLGLTPNEYGQLICKSCGGEIPIPVAAPDESLGDTTTSANADLPTIVDAQHMVHPAGDGSVESMLGDSACYIEKETIGKGGMGEIVLCVEQNTRREVAMKRMLPTAAGHAKHRARFVEEAQVTAQLEHPNIVPVHELGRDEHGAIYFTMKLVKGRSLAEILIASRDGEETHSLVELLQVFLKVCDGVAFAHSRGVVHRDLKPANIMVGDFGEVLVMDWGIARILGRDEIAGEDGVQSSRQDTSHAGLLTVAGTAMGSPSYMPPEQALGRHDKIDHRSDIYSLGAILYNILTLKIPVEGQTARVIMDKVVAGDIHPPERRAPEREIPRELSAVAMKCLAKYRRDRYASVPELQRDISLYLEGRSVSAAPDTFTQALVKLVKRNKAVSVSIAAAVVILIAVVSVSFVRVTGAMQRAIIGEQQAVTERQAAQDARDEQRVTALASSKRFAMQAIEAAETGRLNEAERSVTDAETVALDSPWGPYARGKFARFNNDYSSVADLFRKALRIDPAHTESKDTLLEALAKMGDIKAAEEVLKNIDAITDWQTLQAAGQTFFGVKRWRRCLVLFNRAVELLAKEKDASKGLMVASSEEMKEKIRIAQTKIACTRFAEEIRDLPPDEQVKRVQSKFEEVNGDGVRIGGIEIKNKEWVRAKIPNRAMFLDPLRGLPLQSLTISGTQITDLEPLKGMPLIYLDCVGTRVSDFNPLKGMPLKELSCNHTRISDLSSLKGLSLIYLNCNTTGVSDLSPIKGMPLTYLNCNTTRVTDLGPLKGTPLTHLICSYTRVQDLSPLKGLPLKELQIFGTHVADLTPLKGMSLTKLVCSGSRVIDLGPLKGMPLNELRCDYTKVSDLTPLKGMPLTKLECAETRVSDLTPLQGMKLEKLRFTPKNITKGIEIVRGMKSIREIGWAEKGPWLKPEEFWKKYDAGEFK